MRGTRQRPSGGWSPLGLARPRYPAGSVAAPDPRSHTPPPRAPPPPPPLTISAYRPHTHPAAESGARTRAEHAREHARHRPPEVTEPVRRPGFSGSVCGRTVTRKSQRDETIDPLLLSALPEHGPHASP
uniref:Uncharacterized protein n=1 Tax=Human betaherpesvirus 6A TaxID=32603 RepID=A0A2L2QE34_9BETA|nr:hypothetical protein [Human betaherpesvirus 6A]AVI09306.1 hypothetical protein [Human betaherpesvirus 6A]